MLRLTRAVMVLVIHSMGTFITMKMVQRRIPAMNTAPARIAALEERDIAVEQKYLVIHAGPQKTASTYLQDRSLFYANANILSKDNYVYVGEGASHLSRIYDALKDFSCRKQVQEAATASSSDTDFPLPSCFDTFTISMKQFGDSNVLISSEDFRIPETKSTPAWWTAIENTAAEFGYKVVVVVAYRRLYEWLPSAHIQRNYGGLSDFHWNAWPDQDPEARRVEHLYPLFLRCEYVDRDGGGTALWFPWTPSYLDAMPQKNKKQKNENGSGIETRVLNLHGAHSTETTFFCDMVPEARATCAASQKLEQSLHAEEPRASPSSALGFDALIMAAADAGLINTHLFARRDVSKAAEVYNSEELNRSALDFPLQCPPPEAYAKLLEASLYWDRMLVSEMKDEVAHRAGFWEAVDKKKFCWIDEKATLKREEWKAFFRRYERLSTTTS